jgi:hypothetical protein
MLVVRLLANLPPNMAILRFGREQYQKVGDRDRLILPRETIDPVVDVKVAARLPINHSIE